MANRSKRSKHRRRSSIRSLFGKPKTLRLLLPILIIFAIVIGLYLATQSSQVQSVLGITLANSTSVSTATTPAGTTAQAAQTPSLFSQTKLTPVSVEPNWKDYSNPTFGYALKYPPTMFYHEGNPAADLVHSISFYRQQDSTLPLYLAPEIAVGIFSNPQSQTSAQWLAAHTKSAAGSAANFENVTEPQTIIIGGLDALSFEDKSSGITSHRILTARGNLIFSILVTDFGDGALRGTYWAIVSTLRWSTPRS